MDKGLRQILGYCVGGLLVLGAIPWALWAISNFLDGLVPFGLLGPGPLRLVVAALLAAPGLAFGLWSIVEQDAVGKGGPVQIGKLDISPRTERLVVSGPYRYTRNPMLFGTCLAYGGYAVFLDSAAALALVGLFAAFMLAVVVPSEERRLRADFGEDYEKYRRGTPVFMPRFGKRKGEV